MAAVVAISNQPSTATALQSDTYLPALDGLRAIAILLVIPHNISVLAAHTSGIAYVMGLVANVGWIGVQLFFALSGFLITGNLLDTRKASNYYRAFFARRVLRIFPLYFGSLLVVCVVAPRLFQMPAEFTETLRYLPIYLLFLSNWTQPFGLSVEGFPHFWSLAIEEQFYLLWPLVVHHHAPQKLLRICIGIMVAALIIRVSMIMGGAASGPLYMFTTSRMDALAAGAALAAMLRIPHIAQSLKEHANRLAAATFALLLFGAASTHAYTNEAVTTHSFGYSILAIGFALLVALAAMKSSGVFSMLWKVLTIAPLRLVGRYSYAMYVFHLPLHIFVGSKLLHRLAPQVSTPIALLYLASMTVVTFALAALSYHFFESRFLALKKRFVPAVHPA